MSPQMMRPVWEKVHDAQNMKDGFFWFVPVSSHPEHPMICTATRENLSEHLSSYIATLWQPIKSLYVGCQSGFAHENVSGACLPKEIWISPYYIIKEFLNFLMSRTLKYDDPLPMICLLKYKTQLLYVFWSIKTPLIWREMWLWRQINIIAKTIA